MIFQAAQPQSPSDWKQFTNSKYGYSISFPRDWKITDPVSGVDCLRVQSSNGNCIFEVIILVPPAERMSEVAEFLRDLILQSLRENHGNALRIHRSEVETSQRARLTVQFAENGFSQVTDYHFIGGAVRCYLVNFRTVASYYEVLEVIFGKIVASFSGP